MDKSFLENYLSEFSELLSPDAKYLDLNNAVKLILKSCLIENN